MAGVANVAESARLRLLIGPEILREARQLVDANRVTDARWHDKGRRAFGQVTTLEGPYTAMVMATIDKEGTIMALNTHCTCAGGTKHCVHSAAVLLAALERPEPVEQKQTSAEWERALAGLIPLQSTDREDVAEVALQFDLVPPERNGGRRRIAIRPVVPGANGNWIRANISWQNMHYAGTTAESAQRLRILKEIRGLYLSSGAYFGYGRDIPLLDQAPSRRIWDLLAECVELGLPMLQAGKGQPPVVLSQLAGEQSLEIGRSTDGLELIPRIMLDDAPIDLGSALLLGEPATGIAWWDDSQPTYQRILRLAPLRGPINPAFRALIDAKNTINIPSDDETRFLRDYVPLLRQRLGVTAPAEVVNLPAARPPVLTLTVERLPRHQLSLSWRWSYAVGDLSRTEELWSGPLLGRDRESENATLRRVASALEKVPELFETVSSGTRLAAAVTVGGMTTVTFLTQTLPLLGAMEDVEVVVALDALDAEEAPDYHEAEEAPLIVIAGDEASDDRDWFDLAVSVSVDDETVPFNELFVALAQGQEYLILASGTYFSLDRPEFARLAALIAEAKALSDVRGDTVRVSRFQAGIWEDLDSIGAVGGQAAEWQQSVRQLTGTPESHELPQGLKATLRPYQQAGFDWLATLYGFGLGGVLADDMGLGKTLQTLALFAHARENGLTDQPFLVVAPTSVVFNWAAEAARFTPGLRVVTINETQARRGLALEHVVKHADIVITSYTLFRLEYAEYEEQQWAGLVLDEAQFVKNHQSQAYRCAKKLPAPFKLAITGTPMENHLMELWSLLSITAPGLFASPKRFTEYYRTPIEKGHDPELLAQLRQRVRPLMLRRTKEQVAADLPDKQEQVIELELNAKHRKVYQTHLQRERQKVLGLLGDLKKNRFEIFRSLTLLRQASIDASLIDPLYEAVPSTKLDAVMELVDDVVREGHRTLVFSQFTRFLTKVKDRLAEEGVEHCYLDGSTKDRAAVLKEFKEGTAPVFLISLKAGGFGLNLTEADYCIMLDPWWNPATEAQAVDRVHRIGQTKKVMVYRLVAKDTIEEKVMALKAGKSALFNSVMDGGGFEESTLSAEDIQGLLD